MKLIRTDKLIAVLSLLPLLTVNASLFAFCANAKGMAVIYPDIRDPYQQIFINIAEGVSVYHNDSVKLYAIGETDTPAEIREWLHKSKIDRVIALGKRGLEILPELPQCITAISGATMLSPDTKSISGISLIPAPEMMFRKLRRLVPNIKDIHVIYTNKKNDGLIELAHAAAISEGFNLLPQKTTNIQDTAARYQAVISAMDNRTSALWLHYTGRSVDRAIMTQILEVAWQRNLVVFSSNFSDVKRGVLFSLYPDNYSMGKRLAQLANTLKEKTEFSHKVLLLDTLLTAVNLRTADHLGLYFSKSEKQAFDFMYPPP